MAAIQIPGYTLKRKLGQGGMAAVFLAVQESFGREVAIKIMLPTLAREPGFAERFLREARTMAGLSHPHIIVVHDVGNANGLYFYAMAYHTGGDLTQRLRAGLETREALRITHQIAGALAHAHDQGYVHRDIKPDNVLFRASDSAAILTDFGIAKALGEAQQQLTQIGGTVGTPRYMSPEQARGETLDGRADLYSLGVMLYEMLTGRPPFAASEAVTLAIKHCQDPVPQLPSALAHVQPLVDRLLAKHPAQRPADGREVMAALDALLDPQRPATPQTRPAPGADVTSAPTLLAPALQATVVSTPAPKSFNLGELDMDEDTSANSLALDLASTATPPAAARHVPASAPGRSSPVESRPATESFYRCEESMSGGMLSRSYSAQAAFSCEDYEEFKAQLQKLQAETGEWLQKRGKKARELTLSIQAHPWIHGRILEVLRRLPQENSPLGLLTSQAAVSVHLHADDEPVGELLQLSGKDGQKPKDKTVLS